MSFHSSQVISPLESPQATGLVKIAGSDFPGFGTTDDKVAALERAMVNIHGAISTLAREVERISGEIESARR